MAAVVKFPEVLDYGSRLFDQDDSVPTNIGSRRKNTERAEQDLSSLLGNAFEKHALFRFNPGKKGTLSEEDEKLRIRNPKASHFEIVLASWCEFRMGLPVDPLDFEVSKPSEEFEQELKQRYLRLLNRRSRQ